MTIQASYTHARANLAALLNTVSNEQEVVLIQRRGAADVALIAADELNSLLETAHLLRSPVNGERLLTALNRAQQGDQQGSQPAQSVEDLKASLGLG